MSNLILQEFNDSKTELKEKTLNLFKSAFPKAERPPLWMLKNLIKKDSNEFYVILKDENFAGLVFINTFEDILGIQYLAIDDQKRDEGIGSLIIEQLKRRYPNYRINIAMERLDESAENNNQRISRKNFYLKNDFKSYQVFVNELGVIYELLTFGGKVDFEDYLNLSKNFWHRDVSIFIKDLSK